MTMRTFRSVLPALAACAAAAIAGCGGSSSSGGGGGGGSIFNLPPNAIVITNVSPDTGPISGGTIVNITGSGFAASADTVYIGGVQVASMALKSDTLLEITTPVVLNPGTYDVRIVNAAGISPVESADQFVYTGGSGGGGGGVGTPPEQYDFDFAFGGTQTTGTPPTTTTITMGPILGMTRDSLGQIWAVDAGMTPAVGAATRLWVFNGSGTVLHVFQEPSVTVLANTLTGGVAPMPMTADTVGNVYENVTLVRQTGGVSTTPAATPGSLPTPSATAWDTHAFYFMSYSPPTGLNTFDGFSELVVNRSSPAPPGQFTLTCNNVSDTTADIVPAGLAVVPGTFNPYVALANGDLDGLDVSDTLQPLVLNPTASITSTVKVANSISGLAIPANDGFAYVVDPTSNIGRKVTLTGNETASMGTNTGAGQLNKPGSIVVDPTLNAVYISDINPSTGAGRIMVYSPPGVTPPPPPLP